MITCCLFGPRIFGYPLTLSDTKNQLHLGIDVLMLDILGRGDAMMVNEALEPLEINAHVQVLNITRR